MSYPNPLLLSGFPLLGKQGCSSSGSPESARSTVAHPSRTGKGEPLELRMPLLFTPFDRKETEARRGKAFGPGIAQPSRVGIRAAGFMTSEDTQLGRAPMTPVSGPLLALVPSTVPIDTSLPPQQGMVEVDKTRRNHVPSVSEHCGPGPKGAGHTIGTVQLGCALVLRPLALSEWGRLVLVLGACRLDQDPKCLVLCLTCILPGLGWVKRTYGMI
jgi:hypothetical protein